MKVSLVSGPEPCSHGWTIKATPCPSCLLHCADTLTRFVRCALVLRGVPPDIAASVSYRVVGDHIAELESTPSKTSSA